MPQTIEHLAIIDLLGIPRGLIALTKADIVSSERLIDVAAQINRATAGTVLECAEVLPVSALTGDGIEAFADRLAVAANEIADRSSRARRGRVERSAM